MISGSHCSVDEKSVFYSTVLNGKWLLIFQRIKILINMMSYPGRSGSSKQMTFSSSVVYFMMPTISQTTCSINGVINMMIGKNTVIESSRYYPRVFLHGKRYPTRNLGHGMAQVVSH